ncbi:MAG: hypothetical protein RLZ53_357 [Actinomycetota bacterium]
MNPGFCGEIDCLADLQHPLRYGFDRRCVRRNRELVLPIDSLGWGVAWLFLDWLLGLRKQLPDLVATDLSRNVANLTRVLEGTGLPSGHLASGSVYRS